MSDELPVILVSAEDSAAANTLISELIGEAETEAEGGVERVWVISNKYYTARVRLRALGDRDEPRLERVEAHVALAEGPDALQRRAARALPAAPAVRLALCTARPPAALHAAARALRYEAVPPSPSPCPAPAPAAPPAGPFPELVGVARVREALHEHPWPGLQLRGGPPPADAGALSGSGSESGSGSDAEWEWGEVAEAVRRSDAAAAALEAAAAARGRGGGERLVRADHLLHALAAALRTRPHRL